MSPIQRKHLPLRRGAKAPAGLVGVPRGRRNQVGKKLHQLRMAAGLTQQGLQARLAIKGYGLDQSKIALIESGKRSVWDFEIPILASALKVRVEELFDRVI
jgi:hypothetical protein